MAESRCLAPSRVLTDVKDHTDSVVYGCGLPKGHEGKHRYSTSTVLKCTEAFILRRALEGDPYEVVKRG